MKNIVLIVAPHPDDEVLGCGGTISKHSNCGDKVIVLIVTRGKKEDYPDYKIERVRQEALNAHLLLGVAETRFLEFPAPDLDLVSLADLAKAIYDTIKEYSVNTMYLPHHGDIHHDHKAVFNAGLVAARPVMGNSVKNIYAYETLSETEWAAPFCNDVFIPTEFVNITDFLNTKLEAMQCYSSQLREFPSSRSLETIKALANFRGSTVGFNHAEAFMTIRVIKS